MNKQEVIEEIKTCKSEYDSNSRDVWCYEKGFEDARSSALNSINKLDEPEKPVVPQFVVDWYEENKGDIENSIFDYSFNWDNQDTSSFGKWFSENDNKPIQTLVNMHQFGYEAEKEKLYTAKLKSTGEYLHHDTDALKVHHSFADDYTVKRLKTYHFTKDTLLKYSAWENDFYSVIEVEE